MDYKVDLLFHQSTNLGASTSSPVRTGGWSEGHYYSGSLTALKAAIERLASIRANMLTTATSIVGQRIRIVGGGSQVLTKRYPGVQSLRADIPQVGLLVSCQAKNAPNVRRWVLRGLPDTRVEEGEYSPSTQMQLSISAYQQELDRGGWRFRGRDLSAGISRIESISNTGVVLMEEALAVEEGDFVRVNRSRDDDGDIVSGRFRVSAAVNSFQFTLANWTAGHCVAGKMSFDNHALFLMDGLTFNVSRVVIKKVGRSFFQYVGRRSNRS